MHQHVRWSHGRLSIPTGLPPQLQEFAEFTEAEGQRVPGWERVVGGIAILRFDTTRFGDSTRSTYHYEGDDRSGRVPIRNSVDNGIRFFMRAIATNQAPCGTLLDHTGQLWGTTVRDNPDKTDLMGRLAQVPNDSVAALTYADCHAEPYMKGLGDDNDVRGVMTMTFRPRPAFPGRS